MSVLPELLKTLEQMTPNEQQEVLDLLRARTRPQGIPGELIVAWARENPIDAEDLAVMERVINEECSSAE